jgi:outer membrane receptor protein involved in Fe transport
LESKALFGELYWQVAPEVKLTGGLRYTDDKKRFTPIPSETLLSNPDYLLQKFGVDYTTLPASFQVLYGQPGDGYPALPDINQQWREVTGRFNAQYTPKLDFTDQTMLYASYSRGYKGGGANPPGIGRNAAPEGMTFKPEFINAYEVGTKNSLLDDSLTLNGDVFFYDYKDYQISKIVERSAANENFNARVWGAELEATWEPLPGLRFNFAGGAQDSVLANGSKSIDVMDRTQGNPNWTLVKPSVTFASNCIAPTAIVAKVIQQLGPTDLQDLCPGGGTADYSNFLPGSPMADAIGESYDPLQHPEANYGQGISKDVSGNELPNAPHFTLSVGAQYAIPVTSDWTALVRTDFYWQTNSWARVYNDNPYDVLHGWSNLNLTLDVIKSDGLQLEFYVKNVLNTTAITDAFLNSDDSALTTNVFTTDPRLIGFSITKSF